MLRQQYLELIKGGKVSHFKHKLPLAFRPSFFRNQSQLPNRPRRTLCELYGLGASELEDVAEGVACRQVSLLVLKVLYDDAFDHGEG